MWNSDTKTSSADEPNILDHVGSRPFYFITRNGRLLYTIGTINRRVFVTPFFTIRSIDRMKKTAVVTVLYPFPCIRRNSDAEFLSDVKRLLRTKISMLVDFSRLCGSATVSIPICDDVILTEVKKERFVSSLVVDALQAEKMIWHSKEQVDNTVTLTFSYRKGSDDSIGCMLMTTEKIDIVQIPRGCTKSMTVKNLQAVQLRAPIQRANVTIDMQLNQLERRKFSFI